MKPRFTDKYRFPSGGYTPSGETDIRKTFDRVRRQQKENERESEQKIQQFPQRRSQR